MSDQTESSCGPYGGGVSWFPPRIWLQSSRLFNQDVGLPPFLEPGDPRWMDVDRLQRGLAGCSWPGYIPGPLFVPYISGPMHHPGQQSSKEQFKWRVSLEVAHFFPSEISLSVRDGFLEVGGKHEERPDEHGFIARCFTRKYRLPAEIDATKIISTLSVEGILTVEAPVSKSFVPPAIIIPIQVELEVTGGEPEKELDNCRALEAQCSPPAEGDGEESQQESQQEALGDRAGPQLHDERREPEEESREGPSGESRPPAPVDAEGTAGVPDPPERHEVHADTSKPHEEPDMGGEIQEMTDLGEAAEEITHHEELELGESPPSEGPSQEPEVAAVKQERTE